jgi:3-hydroxybutyryl-CoA dehydratase
MMHDLKAPELSELSEGMSAKFDVTFTRQDLDEFAKIAFDSAPLHHDPEIARAMGYREPISYGLLVFGRFSGLLGMVLPGARTVIHSGSFQMKKPVYVGDKLTYVAEIRKIVKSVRTVILDLKVLRGDELILKGETQCGFQR